MVPVMGLAFGLWIVGAGVVDPRNLNWLKTDLSQVYLGWAFFRLDPHWHFPLSYTNYLSYPAGCCISNTNSAPLLAALFKLLSPFLPASFQYMGLMGLLNATLQAVLGYALCCRFTTGRWMAFAGSLFFLLTPAFYFRMATDMVLSSQWLILFSLWVYFREPSSSKCKAIGLHSLVLFLAGGIHPYLAVMCASMIGAEMFRELRESRSRNLLRLWPWAVPALVLLGSWILFGYIQRGESAPQSGLGGYGEFSFNLLSPIDPNPHNLQSHSPFLPDQKCLPKQNGIYNYIGLGTLLLSALAAVVRRKTTLPAPDFRPLWLVAFGCFCLAVSNRVTLGSSILFEIPLPFHPVGAVLSIFRSSDRFFWPVYYIFLIFVLQRLFSRIATRSLLCLLASLIVLQIVDTQPLRATLRQAFSAPRSDATLLTDPFWSTLGQRFQKMVVLPAWQSRPNDSALPGGPDGWQSFGFIAASQGLALNVNYLARPVPLDDRMQSEVLPAQVRAGKLDADTVYILDPVYLLDFISRQDSGIESRYVDHLLVFWRSATPTSENLAALRQRLREVCADGLDLKQVAQGFVFPQAPIPYVTAQGFKVAGPEAIHSQGRKSDIPLFLPQNRALKRISFDVEPWLDKTGSAQTFSVSLDGVILGEYSLRMPGKVVVKVPDGRQNLPDQFAILHFDWRNPVDSRTLTAGTGGKWVIAYRRMLERIHPSPPPEERDLHAVDFKCMALEFDGD